MTAPRRHFHQIGVDHHSAPLQTREKLSVPAERLPALYDALQATEGLHEFLVLNTCNRVEFYVVGDDTAPSQAADCFCQAQAFTRAEFDALAVSTSGLEAVEHLYAVASGIDSQMIGETEILGQVKNAYQQATERNAAGPVLHRVIQKGLQAAKHVRTHTGITRGQISVGNVAVELAARIFGGLKKSRVLVIGSGEAGDKTVKALRSRGAEDITVSSRTLAKAEALARQVEGQAIAFEHWQRHLALFDIIIGCTAAPGQLLTTETIEQAQEDRVGRPLFLIDLAVPRDFEESAGELPDVFLYNLDDLASIANENLLARQSEIDKCRQILADKAQRVWSHLRLDRE